jgi:hypothetical protein
MPKFPTQTSIQALEIYKRVAANSDLDLSITFSGNVQVATKFDRAVNAIADHFRINSIENRRAQAKQVIQQKFDSEMKILANHLPTRQRQFMDYALGLTIEGENIEDLQKTDSVQSRIAAFTSALHHIKKMGSGDSKESNQIAWQATQEFIANGKRSPDANFARKVSDLTIQWKKELKLGDREAYRLAFNAALLIRRHGIDQELALEILQISGKLHAREGLEKNEALQLAIDLYVPMKNLGIGIDSISNFRKKLLSKLPELKNYEPITQISAAVCCVQLENSGLSDLERLSEIKNRLANIGVMQNIMPKGCRVNQIHKGSHVRGYSKVDSSGLQEFSDKVSTLVNYPTFNQSEIKTKLPDNYQYFEHQFVKDLVRGCRYELRQNGLPDAEFMALESMRRDAMKSRNNTTKISENDYTKWAHHYQRHAGSLPAAEASSRIQSQTLLADVELITAIHSINPTNYITKATGDEISTEVSFSSNRCLEKNKTVINFDATQKRKASILLATPYNSDGTYFELAQVQLFLLKNDEWLPKMQHSNPAVIRECNLTVDPETLDEGKTTCVTKKISETWDLMPDWDDWMSKSPATR